MELQDWLACKQGKQFRYKLEKVQYALDLLGNPEKNQAIIHIAGTNGKGSTVAFLTELCRGHQMKVGSFTSPHLESVHDRIRINHQPISSSEFQQLLEKIYILEKQVRLVYEELSYFEVMMLVMFEYFRFQNLDVILLEVGIGGLLDTTNVVLPDVSVITSIGLDHQEILGHTLREVAFQKAGIIKHHRPVVIGPVDEESFSVIEQVAVEKEASVSYCGRDFDLKEGQFHSLDVDITGIELGLEGDYQLENAAVALQAFLVFVKQKGLRIEEEQVRIALRNTEWAGRLEKIRESPTIYLDGAHNVPAMKRLAEFIQKQPLRKTTILFAALERKDVREMIEVLTKELPETRIVTTCFSYKGVADTKILKDFQHVDSYQDFIEKWQRTAQEDEVLIVTGSLYFISEVRRYFLNKHSDINV